MLQLKKLFLKKIEFHLLIQIPEGRRYLFGSKLLILDTFFTII